MKILITTALPDIESQLDPRFGRSACYLVVDPETLDWQAFPNPAVSASGGAGVQAAQFVAEKQVGAVISGSFGPNAFNVIKASGIPMYQFGSCQSVREVIDQYRGGSLTRVDIPGHAGHHGR